MKNEWGVESGDTDLAGMTKPYSLTAEFGDYPSADFPDVSVGFTTNDIIFTYDQCKAPIQY